MKLNFLTQLSQILKGEVFNVELPSISGECKGIEYRITKWTVENVEFSRFNLNLEGGELKLILEGIRLYTRMHFKAWSKKIEKLKSSFDPTCEIKQFDYTISLRTTDNNVVVTQCNANIGSLTLGTENKGLKKTVFDQVRTVANLDKIAKGKLIKFLVDNMGKYIAKKLQDKLFSMNTKQNVETESKVIAKPKPPTPLSYITKCMLCETNFGLFMKKNHCSYCGGVYCNSCSSNSFASADYGFTKPVRTCDSCLIFLKAKKRIPETPISLPQMGMDSQKPILIRSNSDIGIQKPQIKETQKRHLSMIIP